MSDEVYGSVWRTIFLSMAAVTIFALGSCAFVASECVKSGGNWSGNNGSCSKVSDDTR